MDEGQILHELFSKPCPDGKVRFWMDDQQGGGWIEYVTPEEADRRYEEDEQRYKEDEQRYG